MKNLPISFPFLRSRASVVASALLSVIASGTAARAADLPGRLDSSFATGPQSDSPILAMALQANGQAVVGGTFTQFRGATRNAVARLDANGALDSFNPGLGISPYNGGTTTVAAVAIQPLDQKVIVAGIFDVLNQQPGGGVARLLPNGSLDPTFNVGTGVVDDGGVVGRAYAVALTASNQILVGGAFQTFNGTPLAGIVRLNSDGSVDPTFNPGGFGITANDYGNSVNSIVVDANGSIVIGGYFSAYNGVAAGGVARLLPNGAIDPTFNAGDGAEDGGVTSVAVHANGQVLVGGGYNNFDGIDVSAHLVRLNTDGSLDTSYDPTLTTLFCEGIDCIIAQPDGTALIGGTILEAGGLVNSPHNGVARLLPDGTQDASFESGTSAQDLEAHALVLQPNGRVLEAFAISALVSGGPSNVIRLFDLASAPTVTVAAGVAQTRENSGAPATFVLKLSAAQNAPLVIHYAVQGAARNGYNYKKLSGTATIPAGKTSKTINVIPINQGIKSDAALGVKIVLETGAGYTVGSAKTAKVVIVENK